MGKQRSSYSLYFAAFSINLVVLASGTCYSWTSPFLPKFASNDSSVNPIARPITTSEAGLLVSIINLGLLIGPIISALITEKLGKRTTLLLSTTPLLVAHIICTVAKTVEVFLVARFLMGIATGATWAVIPGYIGEISEPTNRGLLGSLMAVMTTSGSLVGYCIGPFLSMKWFSIVNLIPILVFFISMFFFIPESPYDLIKKNKCKKAEYSLITLRKRTDVYTELAEIKKSIDADNGSSGKFIDLFRSKSLVRAMIISVGVMVVNPLSGICALLGYTQTIFILAGSSIPPANSAIIVGSISLCSTLAHSFLVDRLGRKILITTSCGIVCLSLSLLGTFFYLQQNNFNVNTLAWLPLGCLVLYMAGFYLGLAGIPYVILGELFPPNIKAVAVGFCASTNFSLTFILTLSFPYLIENFSLAYTFWLLAIFMALGVIFCIIIVPETKGKSLQEINIMLTNSNKF